MISNVVLQGHRESATSIERAAIEDAVMEKEECGDDV